MPTTLVRDDLHYYVAALGAAAAVATQRPSGIVQVHLPCFCACQLGWWVLRRPAAWFTARRLDATLLQYAASVAVWVSLAIMACNLVLNALSHAGVAFTSSGVTEHAMTALLVALGVGAQPILTNFTSGLLLVLFRPFRVGDDVGVGDQLFTVQAITAFFVTGTDFTGVHLSLPNSSVLSGKTLTNYTANGSLLLELKVAVRAGRQSCAKVRSAMGAAAAAFDARLAAALEECGVPDARTVASALPACKVQGPCAITERGVQWMLKPLVPELAWLPCIDLGNQCASTTA